jgi:hypothetical protein
MTCVPVITLNASSQGIHEVDYIVGSWLTRRLNLFALILFAQQVLQRILISVLKFDRFEVTCFRLDDVFRKIEHVFRHPLTGNTVEVILFIADLIRIAQGLFP